MDGTSPYRPSDEILAKYADVLVNFALGEGKGIRPGEVVFVKGAACTRPLYFAVCQAVTSAGGHIIHGYEPGDDQDYNFSKDFYELASDEQISFYAERYYEGLAATIDHRIGLLGEADKHALDGVDPHKMMATGLVVKRYRDLLTAKEQHGEFTWTLALYGTEAGAHEAGMTLEEHWRQIIDACYLEDADPIARWQETTAQMDAFRERLNAMAIESVHVVGEDVDLTVTLGEGRCWQCGSGHNIPSFEIFTSPDWRGTEGWISFNQPLYRYGTMVTGIELRFEGGRVVSAIADEGEEALRAMIETENADKLGEFSLTDSRHSRITRFMAHTLYDENVGGRFGNTHVAVGKSFHDCYAGDPEGADWEALGFNDSSVHTDMISTTDRTVTAHLADGSEIVIYADGQFRV
jgi:aminopeptidase